MARAKAYKVICYRSSKLLNEGSSFTTAPGALTCELAALLFTLSTATERYIQTVRDWTRNRCYKVASENLLTNIQSRTVHVQSSLVWNDCCTTR